MTASAPRLSVVIPVYNEERACSRCSIGFTLRSMLSA